jgi:hypothetical protein
MEVPVAPYFALNGTVEPQAKFRAKYVNSGGAVEKMMMATRADRLAFVVPAEVARAIPGAHLSPAGWMTKQGKKSGRAIMDSSATECGHALNSEHAVAVAEGRWGAIHHPTLQDVVLMVLRAMAEDGVPEAEAWQRIILWKTDLRAAYTLLFFHPDHAALLMCPLLFGLVMVFICGVFGWSCTPHAFQVVNRAFDRELKLFFLGLALLCVNNCIGCCRATDRAHDMRTAATVFESLLGDKAHAMDKDEAARALSVIGWWFCLNTQRVSVSSRTLRKMVYLFCRCDVEGQVTLVKMQRLASLASRCAHVYRWMHPFFTPALYTCYTGHTQPKAKFYLPPDAQLAVRLWRVTLVCSSLSPCRFLRDMRSFQPRFQGLVVEMDASLSGVGLLFYQRDATGREVVVGAAGLSLKDFNFGDDSAWQNAAEFIGATMAAATSRSRCGGAASPRSRARRPRASGVGERRTLLSCLLWWPLPAGSTAWALTSRRPPTDGRPVAEGPVGRPRHTAVGHG